MAGAFRIAEGYVEVTADESSYERSMSRLKSGKHSVKVGLELDDKDFTARIARIVRDRSVKLDLKLASLGPLTELAKLTADRTMKVLVDLESTKAFADMDRLTRPRTVKVDLDLDRSALSTLGGHTYTASILPEINQAALERVVAKLDKLTVDRTVRILASADTRVAADELRNLTARRRARIGVDVDTRVAADELANLARTRTARINAELRSGDTAARLAALSRDRRVGLDVDVRGGGLSSLTGSSGGIGSLVKSLANLKAAAVGAFPTLSSLGQSLVQMGPLAAVAVPSVLSLATAFAAVKIGMSGVGDAIKAALAPAATSGSAATSSLRSVQNAEEALAKAAQGVRDAEVNAAAARVKAARDVADAQQSLKGTVRDVADANHAAIESVASAERDLANAQRAARQAQLDLTAARKAAKAELEDLKNQLTDSQLSQREDELALADAKKALAAATADGSTATEEDRAKAQLAYEQAAQALAEQELQTQRLADQNTEADKAGVEGSGAVKDAKQAIADANQDVADKAQALADAQRSADEAAVDGAQRVAKAERDVADARADATKAAVDGARSIKDAQQAVTDAARSLADAQTSAAAAASKTADAMAKLAPNARTFVAAILAMRGAWTALRLDVQNRLFAGLGASFTTMGRSSLPVLRGGLVGMAGVLNTMAKNAMAAVTNLAKTGTLKRVFDGLTAGMKPLARIPGQFVTALGQLSVAASPAFKRITTAAGGMADNIMKKLSTAFKNGHLEDAISGALNIAKQFGHLLGDIAGTISNVMKAAAAGGGDALGTLGSVFSELRKITAMPEVQKALASIFRALNAVSTLLVGTLGKALGQLLMGLAPVADAITKVLSSLGNAGPLIGGILLAANPLIGTFVLLAPIIGKLAKPLVGLVNALAPLLTGLSDFAGGLISALAPVIGSVITVLATVLKALAPVFAKIAPMILLVVNTLAGPLTDIIGSLVPLIGPLVGIFSSMDMAMLPLIPTILKLVPPVAQLILALSNLLLHVLTPLLPLIDLVAAGIAGALGGALNVLVPILTVVITGITAFTNALTAAVDWVVSKFQWLYDTLVGHSIIPDLVKAITQWFTTLWTSTKRIFTDLVNGVTALWKNLWSTVRAAWNVAWSGLQTAFTSARSWLTNTFTGIRSAITTTWNGLWSGVRSTFSTVIGTVQSRVGSFVSAVKSAFTNLRDGIGSIWAGVREKVAAPIRWVISKVYTQGIERMWNKIAGKISSKLTLPDIPLGFNKGGIVPGEGTKDTVPAMLTPGERVLSLAQIAKLGGHAAIDRMVGAGGSKGPHYSAGGTIGGILSDVGGAVSGAVDWTKNIVRGGLADVAAKAIKALVNPLIDRIPSGSGDFSKLAKGLPTQALGGMLSFLKADDKKNTGGQINYSPGAGVAQWAPTILQALSLLGQPPSWLGTVERRMNQESGGNPRAVNLWDSNAKAGMPSVGLMQVIGPTFKAHAGRFAQTGPFLYGTSVNPLANTFAGLDYAIGRYGSLSALNRPGGYDSGGLLKPGATMAVNRTGRPERVLNANHTELLDQALTRLASAPQAAPTGPPVINVTAELTVNSMTVPSLQEQKRFAKEMAYQMGKAIDFESGVNDRKWKRLR